MTIAQAQVANSTTDLYTSSGDSVVTSMIFCNTSGSDATLTVYVIPNGSSAGDSTTILKTVTVLTTDTYVFDTSRLLLSTSDKISAVSSVNNAITATITYMGV